MSDKILQFEISSLLDSGTGKREIYSFKAPIKFENAKSDIIGKVEIMKIDDGVNVKVTDCEIGMRFECKKCLKKFTGKIKIPFAERQFLLENPEKTEDPNDLYLINKKNLTIDLSEMMRQEIILHFPVVPVCSKSCEGLWKYYKQNEPEENKPLAILKDLIK